VLGFAVKDQRRLHLWIALWAATFLPGCSCSSSMGLRSPRDGATLIDGEPDVAARLDAIIEPDISDGPPGIGTEKGTDAEATSRDGPAQPDWAPLSEVPGEAAGSMFRSARVSRSFHLCPDTMDCKSYVELSADGSLSVDKENDLTHAVRAAQVSAADFDGALVILNDPELLALLQGPPGCAFTRDASVDMALEIGDLRAVASIANCTQQPIVAADAMMRALEQKYLP
jgi:hypothetical protein